MKVVSGRLARGLRLSTDQTLSELRAQQSKFSSALDAMSDMIEECESSDDEGEGTAGRYGATGLLWRIGDMGVTALSYRVQGSGDGTRSVTVLLQCQGGRRQTRVPHDRRGSDCGTAPPVGAHSCRRYAVILGAGVAATVVLGARHIRHASIVVAIVTVGVPIEYQCHPAQRGCRVRQCV